MTQPVVLPSGHKLLAADLDAYEELTEPWVSFTPTWTATTTNPTIGNGTINAAYKQVGKTVFYRGEIVLGSSTTPGSGTYELSWPVPPISLANTNGGIIGPAYVLDFGGTAYAGVIVSVTTTALRIVANGVFITNAAPFAFGVNDRLSWFLIYEAA